MEKRIPENLVFGLDIGTRSVVGTVGYTQKDDFYVVAQCVKEHDTRAMVDGQIHDIGKVGETIAIVKNKLEQQIDRPLNEVCIAAAGRVLKTVTTEAELEFGEDTVITQELIHSLDLIGVENAHNMISEEERDKMKFYCVGYSVVKYFLDDYPMSNLENHKGRKISQETIATFLPEEVVNSLYTAVHLAGLEVANLTLEPIAAIQVAIPEMYRMLNIALVDVGAGTSDISITKDGSIVAYGMIPYAGDEITEIIAKNYLVDFKTAEKIKLGVGESNEVTFKDIMGLEITVTKEQVTELVKPMIEKITHSVAEKIKELNGGKTVSAVFVVGGGGKFGGFTDQLAKELDLMEGRVGLRGEEVLQEVHFYQEDIKKDPLLVTPIGICLNFYEQKNNFIFVQLNGERVKLYNNSHLTVVDAAMHMKFPNEDLFPKRGRELKFTVNGQERMVRGSLGEAAVIKINGEPAGLNTPIDANDKIQIRPSTAGEEAACMVQELPEYKAEMKVVVNGKNITCPKYMEVNGELVPGQYSIQNGDIIENRDYYTLKQLLDFMDVILDMNVKIYINNKIADMDGMVYDNFSVDFDEKNVSAYMDLPEAEPEDIEALRLKQEMEAETEEAGEDGEKIEEKTKIEKIPRSISVMVNKKPVLLTGKSEYVFVDVFDFIDFDLSGSKGRRIVTKQNGETAEYMHPLDSGDVLEIFWEELSGFGGQDTKESR